MPRIKMLPDNGDAVHLCVTGAGSDEAGSVTDGVLVGSVVRRRAAVDGAPQRVAIIDEGISHEFPVSIHYRNGRKRRLVRLRAGMDFRRDASPGVR
jgi:hypothetical protein